jgi:hypothetical protein
MLYKWTAWGDRVGEGINDAEHVEVAAVAKRNNPDSPYLVANEIVAARIGQCLGVPVPSFGVVEKDHVFYFFGWHFALAGEETPPIDPRRLCELMPTEALGIVAFDMLIANEDRHEWNVEARLARKPHEVVVYDHERALLGSHPGRGVRRLEEVRDELVIDRPPGDPQHCLVGHVRDASSLFIWSESLRQLPRLCVANAAAEARRYGGITVNEELALVDYIMRRREVVPVLLREALESGELGPIQNWGLPECTPPTL